LTSPLRALEAHTERTAALRDTCLTFLLKTSTSLAYLCLKSCGHSLPFPEGRLQAPPTSNRFLQNTLVSAWVLVALHQ